MIYTIECLASLYGTRFYFRLEHSFTIGTSSAEKIKKVYCKFILNFSKPNIDKHLYSCSKESKLLDLQHLSCNRKSFLGTQIRVKMFKQYDGLFRRTNIFFLCSSSKNDVLIYLLLNITEFFYGYPLLCHQLYGRYCQYKIC